MQKLFSEKVTRWLLPVVLILFLLEMLTLPLVMNFTYADRSQQPDHRLSYTMNYLHWSRGTDVDANGVALLDVFDAHYPGVLSENGENVVAPGTDGYNIVRLTNKVEGHIRYTAVLYRIRTSDKLPVDVALVGDYTDTTRYSLPAGVSHSQVIRAVNGELKGYEHQDFDIAWKWDFEESLQQDIVDTMLGDRDRLDTVTVGLYVVVEDSNSYHIPKTGDTSNVQMYFALMVISLFLLILLLWERRKETEEE